MRSAYAVLTDRGYDQTTMADIARHANVGQGTLYRYYPSKRDLLDDVFDYAVTKAARALRIGSLASLDLTDYHQAMELITVFGTRLFDLVDEDPAIVRLLTVESSAIDPELRFRVSGLLSTLDVAFARLFETANPDHASVDHRDTWALLGRLVMGLSGPGLLMSMRGDRTAESRATFLASISAIADQGLLAEDTAEGETSDA
ncbi:TetR/AcrR family transcriptional regulator [Mycobacterium sp. 360MFTsu5.1]|uniref:TetR/AcrR family transcriptional regulator n=1 Tax=Mycobacterium sp. 360MFTsu5.1 TaxID=1172186 RepID=UPI000367D133|nr:TetR/AcrR family transcriptional regulator [Mycobacterium sp. 360MFTsu5.1]